jgi:PGF-CTERM protein
VSVDYRFDTPGTYALAVNGVQVGTVTVDPSPSTPTATTGPTTRPTTATPTDAAGTTSTPADGSGSDTPTALPGTDPGQSVTSPSPGTPADGSGFTVLLALLALGFVALFARRQRP